VDRPATDDRADRQRAGQQAERDHGPDQGGVPARVGDQVQAAVWARPNAANTIEVTATPQANPTVTARRGGGWGS